LLHSSRWSLAHCQRAPVLDSNPRLPPKGARPKLSWMRRCFVSLILLLAAYYFPAFTENVRAQSAAGSDTPQTGVVLTKLHDPAYPQMAQMAGNYGDVVLTLRIKQDGTIESVSVVSGPAMLQQAAIDSAQQSHFECRECTDGATLYSLTYTFQFSNEDCCAGSTGAPTVSQSENRVLVVAAPFCFCDPARSRKVRSAKCLYLWKCGIR